MKTGGLIADINGLWQVVHDSGTFPAAVSTYDITGLEGNSTDEYDLIVYTPYKGAGPGGDFIFNSDSVNNYYQRLLGNNASASAARGSGASSFFGVDCSGDGQITYTRHKIRSTGSRKCVNRFQLFRAYGTQATYLGIFGCVWVSSNELTSINFSSAATIWGVGTRIILLKKVVGNGGRLTGSLNVKGEISNAWNRVYEETLASAASSINVTGLEGNTDSIYRIIIKAKAEAATDLDWVSLQINGDTGANYGIQRLRANASTLSASRSTGATSWPLAYVVAGECGTMEILLYAKAGGYRVFLAEAFSGTTASAIGFYEALAAVWDNSVSEITSLQIIRTGAGDFEAGTYVAVEKLALT